MMHTSNIVRQCQDQRDRLDHNITTRSKSRTLPITEFGVHEYHGGHYISYLNRDVRLVKDRITYISLQRHNDARAVPNYIFSPRLNFLITQKTFMQKTLLG